MPETDPSDLIHDLINDFFSQLFSFFRKVLTRFTTNLQNSFTEVSARRWTKTILSVVFYIIIRPYIERFFRWSSERDRKRREEKEKKAAEATGFEEGRKAKVSANELRGTGGAESGRVLGEVDDTDDEVDNEKAGNGNGNGDEQEEGEAIKFAKASGVPEWGKNARKRQKKQAKNMSEYPSHNLTDEQLLSLLDWSEDEGEKA